MIIEIHWEIWGVTNDTQLILHPLGVCRAMVYGNRANECIVWRHLAALWGHQQLRRCSFLTRGCIWRRSNLKSFQRRLLGGEGKSRGVSWEHVGPGLWLLVNSGSRILKLLITPFPSKCRLWALRPACLAPGC